MIDLVHWAIIGLVVAAEAWLTLSARRELRQDHGDRLEELERNHAEDIRRRAGVGLMPDWYHYEDAADEVFAKQEDQLRLFASMALTVGVFGTMSTMAVSLATAGGGERSLLEATLGTLGWAIGASAGGVAVHLLIAIFFLRTQHKQAGEATTALRRRLKAVADEMPPEPPSMVAFREELEEIKSTVETHLARAVKESLESLPEAVAGLMEVLGRLDKSVTEHVSSAKALQESTAESTPKLVAAVASIDALSKSLASTADKVAAVPDRLDAGLGRMDASVTKVSDGLAALPEHLDTRFQKSLDGWADQTRGYNTSMAERMEVVGNQLRGASTGLADRVQLLTDTWESRAVNAMDTALTRHAEALQSQVQEGLSNPVQRTAANLADVREQTAELSAALRGLQPAIAELLEATTQATEQMRRTHEGHVQDAVDRLNGVMMEVRAGLARASGGSALQADHRVEQKLGDLQRSMAVLATQARKPWLQRTVEGVSDTFRWIGDLATGRR